MATVMKEFIDRFAQMQKLANETLAAEPGALVGVKDLPGSEHDATVPASATEPDKEVAQGQPAGATTAEGAVNGGDAKPMNEGKLEVDQPLENPDKKPLITDDALTAKEASSHLDKLVGELLADIKGGQQKQAAAKPAEPAKPEGAQKQAQDGAAADDKGKAGEPAKGEEKKAEPKKMLDLNDPEVLSKIAAATATFMAGRNAAETAIKNAVEKKAHALALVKAACVKAAQESGLNPEDAAAAADNAMAAAGIPAGEIAGADAGAAAGAEAGAAAGADAGASGADVDIPNDVTEEELGAAIVDLVRSGQLDVDTAKAIVDEIAGDAGDAGDASGAGEGITEDQAAEIIADGLQSGEITPDQAKEIVNAIESGSGADASAAAEAQGAADAATAAQEAADEAQGAADAENAVKQAAADIRKDAITKVASAIVAKRQQVKQAEAAKGSQPASEQPKGLLKKVASILQKRKDEFDAKAQEAQKQAAAKPSAEDSYLAGFRKKAEEMGVDPVKLAQYVTANKERFAKAVR